MKTSSIKQLTAIRFLVSEATRAIESPGTERALAILHIHDALDWMFQIAYKEIVGKRTKRKMYMSDYAEEIAKVKRDLVDIGNTVTVNNLRNNFKHDSIFPDPEITKEMVMWAENQINTLSLAVFNKPLNEIDLTVLLPEDDIKEQISKADDAFAQKQIVEAYCFLAIAFAMLKHTLQTNIEEVTTKKAIFETQFTFASAFHVGIGEIGQLTDPGFGGMTRKNHKVEQAWDQLIQGVEYLVDTSFINYLGIGLHSYYLFQACTPKPQRSLSGKYHCDYSDSLENKMRASDYTQQRDFVIDAVLKAQSKLL